MRYILLLLMLAAAVSSSSAQQSDNCTTVVDHRQPGPDDAGRSEQRPGGTGPQRRDIPGEGTFTVLDGPACADGLVWRQVQYGDLIGWTAQGSGESRAGPDPGHRAGHQHGTTDYQH